MVPTDMYSEALEGATVIRIASERVPTLAERERMCVAAFECSGLRFQGRAKDSRNTNKVYALAPVDRVADGIRDIVRFIAGKHGPGKVWAVGGGIQRDGRRHAVPISYIGFGLDDDLRGARKDDAEHIILACYYHHAD
ncbi:MAG TPA: hypothetical protein VN181_07555 [Thermoanaerobaculia bacterium]|nr:hypothetical protein [Thermoanaerobaculia bacterium]